LTFGASSPLGPGDDELLVFRTSDRPVPAQTNIEVVSKEKGRYHNIVHRAHFPLPDSKSAKPDSLPRTISIKQGGRSLPCVFEYGFGACRDGLGKHPSPNIFMALTLHTAKAVGFLSGERPQSISVSGNLQARGVSSPRPIWFCATRHMYPHGRRTCYQYAGSFPHF
jgi:hypothetical protein